MDTVAEEADMAIEWHEDPDAALEKAGDLGLPALFDFNAAPD